MSRRSRNHALELVDQERDRQEATRVLTAAHDSWWFQNGLGEEALREELVQVAAVAVAWLVAWLEALL